MTAVGTLYNPQEIPEEKFLESFVVRHALLEDLLREIRETAPGERFRHTILQGLRGQGKTTLLRKIALCVRDDPAFSPWLIPVLFREEEYSVVSLCRLWERTADYLAERPGFETLPDEFEAGLASPHYEADCFDILARTLEREDKHLLLLIDNFGEMLDKFGKTDQQRLREILQTSRHIRIVAGSAATLEQHYDHGKPFFNFFRLRTLEGLNAQEARDFMLSLGNEEQKQRMAEILETRPGKQEALRRLTAGVPRTLALLFEIFLDDDGSAMDDLEVLLDRVTPLYKHRLDDLPTQQQAIVYEIAMGRDALSVKEIAAKTRLPSKQISAQLQLLEKNRIVRAIATSTKNKLYQLEERFFNIWCLMRLGRSGDKRRAVWLVRFLEIWCDQEELAERVRRHIEALKHGRISKENAIFLAQAFCELLRDSELERELHQATAERFGKEVLSLLSHDDFLLWNKAFDLIRKSDFYGAITCLVSIAEKNYKDSVEALELTYRILDKNALISDFSSKVQTITEQLNSTIKKMEESFLQLFNSAKARSADHGSLAMQFSKIFFEQFSEEMHERATNNWESPQAILILSLSSLQKEEFRRGFKQVDAALNRQNVAIDEARIEVVATIKMLAAKSQTAFASLSEILCVRHNLSPRSMYAKQDEQEETGSGAAPHSQRIH